MTERKIEVNDRTARNLQGLMRGVDAAQAQLLAYFQAVCDGEGLENATLKAVSLTPPIVTVEINDGERT